jgi:hypothetical protein
VRFGIVKSGNHVLSLSSKGAGTDARRMPEAPTRGRVLATRFLPSYVSVVSLLDVVEARSLWTTLALWYTLFLLTNKIFCGTHNRRRYYQEGSWRRQW